MPADDTLRQKKRVESGELRCDRRQVRDVEGSTASHSLRMLLACRAAANGRDVCDARIEQRLTQHAFRSLYTRVSASSEAWQRQEVVSFTLVRNSGEVCGVGAGTSHEVYV